MAYKTALGGICLLGLTLASNLAAANGMDVFREDYGTLFETGNVVEFNGGFVRGYVDGNMNSPYLGSTGSVLPNIGTMSFSGKVDISNNLSAAVFIDQLHRAPLNFNNYPLLGQVGSYLHDTEYTALMRYKFNENWSLFGGPRINSFVAHVFGFGVDSSLSDNAGLGYTLGAAYEVSELGILARLSYKSSIDHSLTGTTTYTVAGVGAIPVPGPVDMRLPQSVMFDGRVPIFENTFALFAATWTIGGRPSCGPSPRSAITHPRPTTTIPGCSKQGSRVS